MKKKVAKQSRHQNKTSQKTPTNKGPQFLRKSDMEAAQHIQTIIYRGGISLERTTAPIITSTTVY